MEKRRKGEKEKGRKGDAGIRKREDAATLRGDFSVLSLLVSPSPRLPVFLSVCPVAPYF
jgi:hypothetical protein